MNKKSIFIFFLAALLLFTGISPMTVYAADRNTYLLKINRKQNVVTAYENIDGEWVPIRAMLASCGADTPLGTYHIGAKYRWRLMFGGTYSQYASRIVEHILFHSVPYWTKDPSNVEQAEFDKLGEKRSMGCVRLCVADARWIYKNCPAGTDVVFYDDADDPGPLGKPDNIKRALGGGWDPTDKWSKDNPYNGLKPTLTIDGRLTLPCGQGTYNLLTGIKALNSVGKGQTKDVDITGYIDFYTPGKYTLTYTLTDVLGRRVSKKRYVVITDEFE